MPQFTATVAPSGESILLIAKDGEGNPTGITSVTSPNAIQQIQLTGVPSGNAFALSFGGQTTAPITTASSDPLVYFLWTFPTIAGHSYNLAVNFFGAHGGGFGSLGYEAITDAGVVSYTVLSDTSPDEFIDGSCPSGYPAFWEPVASGIVATGSTTRLRCTAAIGNSISAAGVRVEDVTAGTVAHYDLTQEGSFSFVPAEGQWNTETSVNYYAGTQYYTYGGSGTGEVVVIAPGDSTATAILQSALWALSSVEPGGMSVLDQSGSGHGVYQVTCEGGLAGSTQPLITCSDPNVSITSISAGGLAPTFTPPGGAAVPVTGWLPCENQALPAMIGVIPQLSPAVQTCPVGRLPYTSPAAPACVGFPQLYNTASWNGTLTPAAGTLSNAPIFGWGEGMTMGFPFPLLTPGTYQIAITYPTSPITFTTSVNSTVFPLSTATQFLIKDNFGNILDTLSIDQSQPPVDYQSEGFGWKVLGSWTTTAANSGLLVVMTTVGQSTAAAGEPQVVAILDGVQITRTSTPPPPPSLVDGGTLSIPDGWCMTQAGAVPAIPSLAVAPPSPNAILPPFVAGPKTMRVGYNVEPMSYYNDFTPFSNMAYMIPAMGSVQDANGYPTRVVTPSYSPGTRDYPVLLGAGDTIAGDPPEGSFVINPGLFAMMWDGDPRYILSSNNPQQTTVTLQSVPKPAGVTQANWAVYRIEFDPVQIAKPCFNFYLYGSTQDMELDPTGNTWVVDLANLALYPPDPTDPTGNTIWGLDTATNTYTYPPRWHPWFLGFLEGMQSIRFMDAMETNENPVYLYSDYKPDTHANRNSTSMVNQVIPVASVRQAPADIAWFQDYNQVVMEVITSAPHGLYDGCAINFYGCGTAEFSDGTSQVMDGGVNGTVHVVDDVTLTIAAWAGNAPATMTNVLTPAGGTLVLPTRGTVWSLEDVASLAAAVPTVTCIHFNQSLTSDTSVGGCCDQTAAFFLANTPPGFKIYVEVGNEVWNGSFPTNAWGRFSEAAITGNYYGGYETWFADQCKRVHDRWVAIYAAAGRSDDVRCLYGMFTGQGGSAEVLLGRAQQNGARVDAVCIATYFDIWPNAFYSADQMPTFDKMTTAQMLDYMEFTVVYGGYTENDISYLPPILAKYGYSAAEIVAYEGSPSTLLPSSPLGQSPPGVTPNYAIRQNSIKRHPRMYGALLQYAQTCQDAGLALWNYFDIGANPSFNCWNSYEYANQPRGTGDMVADAINVTNPLDKNKTFNEVGGAWHYWSTLVAPPVTTTTTNKTIAGRNGRIRAIGFPKGEFRLS
jgi:hypothetical protein